MVGVERSAATDAERELKYDYGEMMTIIKPRGH